MGGNIHLDPTEPQAFLGSSLRLEAELLSAVNMGAPRTSKSAFWGHSGKPVLSLK